MKKLGLLSVGLMSLLLLAGCGPKEEVKNVVVANGDRVTINYTATVNDGSNDVIERDMSKVVELGKEELFNVFDQDLLGKKVDEHFKKTVKGEVLYKNRFSDGNVQEIPLQVFKDTNTDVTTGQKLDLGEMKGIVTKITDEYVLIDSNPRYLDKDVVVDIVITAIQKEKTEESK
ncbi:MAG: hypothetical protein CR971_01905 [candidate division SR1 bacterium]|nr:MAG: hypothetical protein CR971_01905 [candidate division SR1 bacterium]